MCVFLQYPGNCTWTSRTKTVRKCHVDRYSLELSNFDLCQNYSFTLHVQQDLEYHISAMDDDRKLSPEHVEEKCSGKVPRSHKEIMESMGYEQDFPPNKRNKTVWEELLAEFPCPPELQHQVWANRIKRLFRKDCGLFASWDCECLKCTTALAEEIHLYHTIESASESMLPIEPMDTVDTVPVLKESLMTTVDLRSVGSAYEPVLGRKNTNNEDVNGVFSGHVHLFLDQNHVGATDGPHTPFLTVLRMTEGERPIQPPREMWLRAKTIVPEHLSFKYCGL